MKKIWQLVKDWFWFMSHSKVFHGIQSYWKHPLVFFKTLKISFKFIYDMNDWYNICQTKGTIEAYRDLDRRI